MASEKSKVRVTVSENGPYIVTGDIPLAKQTIATDAEGGSEEWQKGRPLRIEKPMLCAVAVVANQAVLRRLTSQDRF